NRIEPTTDRYTSESHGRVPTDSWNYSPWVPLAPRPSQGMLNNPLGTYAENDKSIDRRRTALYSVQPACDCASASSFLPIGICGSKRTQSIYLHPCFIYILFNSCVIHLYFLLLLFF